ncbi:hypothetical protein AJ80_02648 [Polytolypa hystricis UAMH7299]|uniref:GPI anchored cell wall protein n=1 Tax=Polytolypa hystricis (strain UAMH7299) TaxID=1447883 RepID=A0A2B7YQU2_POLH7|nr:hypothetical protein AJ80_02648 [Polytolypa hystricis UAMH7299]
MAMKSIIGLALLGLASAAQTSSVVSVFIPGTDTQSLVGSIIGNDATATTYLIQCAPGVDSSDCGMGPGLTLVSGPKTAALTMGVRDSEFYGEINCSMGGTTLAVCTEIMSGSEANFPGTETATFKSSDIGFMPVTVTAGSITSAAATAPTTTATASGSNALESGTAAANTADASAPASESSTGGMPQITGNAKLVISGAAVALAAIVM